MQVEVSCKNLIVNYGVHCALSIEHLTLRGGVVALLGHNGAGKSTLMKALLDLLPHPPRSLQVRGPDGELFTSSSHMAFCPETGAIFEDISVAEYVGLWCRLKHHDSNYYRKAGQTYMELLEISPLLRKKGRELSKGQRRRVQTAIGFLTKPRLFLIDEPFDGLDVQRTQELADIILAHRESTSFVISSHRMDVMERLADAALVLEQGLVATAGSIEDVCKSLAGSNLLITHAANPTHLCEMLKAQLPSALVSQLGDQVSVTGHTLDPDRVRSLVTSVDQNGARLINGRASLTDAMSIHLRAAHARAAPNN